MNEDWTELYRPENLSEVLGNPKAVKDLREWAISWEAGSPTEKAVVLIGPPGIGKTSTALALAREFNWGVVEMNASDQRNADAIKRIAVRGAMSDTFTDTGEFLSAKDGRRKLVILDEADNVFGREDHGGIPAIAELVRTTKQPVILIVNDFYELSRRSSAIKTGTLQIKFSKVQSATARSVLKRIAAAQGVEVDENALTSIAERANGDMRAAIRDLQAVCQGSDHCRMEDLRGLGDRLSKRSMYELMGDILQGSNCAKAKITMADADEDLDYVMKWLDENIPLVYKDPEELFRAYVHMSRASQFHSRVTIRQYYGFWSYVGDLMTYGVCSSKTSPKRGYFQYNFPKMLLRLSRTKDSRGVKSSLALKLGSECHSSIKQTVEDILPYFRELYKKDNDFRLAQSMKLSLELEEVAYLLDGKIDSPAVKHVMQEMEGAGRKTVREEPDVPGKADAEKPKRGRKKAKEEAPAAVREEPKEEKKEAPKEAPKEEKKAAAKNDEPKGTQMTLF